MKRYITICNKVNQDVLRRNNTFLKEAPLIEGVKID